MNEESHDEVLWHPTRESVAGTGIASFARRVAQQHGIDLGGDIPDYDRLWRWSIDHLETFWSEFATWSGVFPNVPVEEVLTQLEMPGASWFPGTHLNYAELALQYDGTALVVTSEETEPVEVSWAELRGKVGAFAATLRRLGVHAGDRVAGYLPNIPEAVVAFLGAASVGAVWSSCAPDFGSRAVLDRFAQIQPTVLVAVDGYRFNGKEYDRRDVVTELQEALPGLRQTIVVSRLGNGVLESTLPWSEAVAAQAEPVFERVAFDHPLWIVFSSGTTGLPKGIVHGHGGIALEQRKFAQLHLDLAEGDRLFWYASTAWIMWNISVSALLSGVTVVVHDGAPGYPSLDAQFALAARAGVTYLGTSASYLSACEKADLRPGESHDLGPLRGVGSTGSPLPASTARWVYAAVKQDVLLGSQSGGTDVATAFIGSSPLLPVLAGKLQRPTLGVAVASWDDDGRPVTGRVGELVVTEPMPSMPLCFWNDPDGSRYHQAYFDTWPGVWRHGDWLEIDAAGGCRITGRSDSTLNRYGVRMGTADIYAAVEAIPGVADCVVLGVELTDGGYWMPLFVQLAPGAELTSDLVAEIKASIRTLASPRHVPDDVIEVPAIPYTRTGKRLEVPLKRLFQGATAAEAVNLDTVLDASAVEHFVQLAAKGHQDGG